ncbi:hypothetical protein Tco_0553827 [Tanacetum coccineum]
MVEKIEVSEIGLLTCLDQGLRGRVCVCNLNCIENKMNRENVVENVLKRYRIYLLGMKGTQNNQDRDLVLRRKKEKSLDYNDSFLGEYECSSLALDTEEKRDKKEEIGSLETRSNHVEKGEVGGDFGVVRLQTCLTEILSFLEKFGGGFEQDIDDEDEKDKEDEEGAGEV